MSLSEIRLIYRLIPPPDSGSVPGADRSPLPSAPAHTPQWSDILAQSKKHGPVRPSSQDALPHVGQRSWGLNPQRGLWYFAILSKRPFKIPIPARLALPNLLEGPPFSLPEIGAIPTPSS